jgi:hypothetical protein
VIAVTSWVTTAAPAFLREHNLLFVNRMGVVQYNTTLTDIDEAASAPPLSSATFVMAFPG